MQLLYLPYLFESWKRNLAYQPFFDADTVGLTEFYSTKQLSESLWCILATMAWFWFFSFHLSYFLSSLFA